MSGRALLVAIVLLAAAGAVPLASAAKGKASSPTPSSPLGEPIPNPKGATGLAAAKPSARGSGDAILLASALGALSLGILAVGAWAAHRSKRTKVHKPPRRSFEWGRRLGRGERARSTGDAMTRIAAAHDVWKVARAAPHGPGLRVVGEPKRGRTCEQAAGYLTGLLEGAWAADVLVVHDVCGARSGAPCVYDVMPARGARSGPALSGSASPTAGSRTPGSSDERRRSPPARVGGS